MISQTTNYPLGNPSVTPYVYALSYQTIASAPLTFIGGTIISDTIRSANGYSSGSKIVAVEIRLINVNIECPAASALNAQAMLTLTYNNTTYRWLGNGSYNCIAPLERTIGAVTTIQRLVSPSSANFVVLIPANYSSSVFIITVNNSTTGAAISTGDFVMYNLEWVEYVSRY